MRRSTARSPLETLPGSTARPQRPMSPTTGAFLLSLLLAPLAALHQGGDAQEPRDEPGVRRSAGNEGEQEATLLHDFMESLDTVVFDIEDALFEPGAEPSAEDWARHVEAVVALQGSGLAAKGELPRTVQGEIDRAQTDHAASREPGVEGEGRHRHRAPGDAEVRRVEDPVPGVGRGRIDAREEHRRVSRHRGQAEVRQVGPAADEAQRDGHDPDAQRAFGGAGGGGLHGRMIGPRGRLRNGGLASMGLQVAAGAAGPARTQRRRRRGLKASCPFDSSSSSAMTARR